MTLFEEMDANLARGLLYRGSDEAHCEQIGIHFASLLADGSRMIVIIRCLKLSLATLCFAVTARAQVCEDIFAFDLKAAIDFGLQHPTENLIDPNAREVLQGKILVTVGGFLSDIMALRHGTKNSYYAEMRKAASAYGMQLAEPFWIESFGSICWNGARLARYLEEISKANPNKQIVVMGHSMGGPTLMEALALKPSLIAPAANGKRPVEFALSIQGAHRGTPAATAALLYLTWPGVRLLLGGILSMLPGRHESDIKARITANIQLQSDLNEVFHYLPTEQAIADLQGAAKLSAMSSALWNRLPIVFGGERIYEGHTDAVLPTQSQTLTWVGRPISSVFKMDHMLLLANGLTISPENAPEVNRSAAFAILNRIGNLIEKN